MTPPLKWTLKYSSPARQKTSFSCQGLMENAYADVQLTFFVLCRAGRLQTERAPVQGCIICWIDIADARALQRSSYECGLSVAAHPYPRRRRLQEAPPSRHWRQSTRPAPSRAQAWRQVFVSRCAPSSARLQVPTWTADKRIEPQDNHVLTTYSMGNSWALPPPCPTSCMPKPNRWRPRVPVSSSATGLCLTNLNSTHSVVSAGP